MTLRTAALGAFAISLIVTACGGGDSERAITLPEESSPQPVAEATRVLTADDLALALITINDMPTGWAGMLQSDADVDVILGGQSYESTEYLREEADFERGPSGPYLRQTLDLFPSGGAEGTFRQWTDLVSTGDWTETFDDGSTRTWQLVALSFPMIGDDTFAFRMTRQDEFYGTTTSDVVLFRRGDVTSWLFHTTVGSDPPDASFTERYVRLADQKLQDALRGVD